MSEGRLFQILYFLLDKGEATAADLADRWDKKKLMAARGKKVYLQLQDDSRSR